MANILSPTWALILRLLLLLVVLYADTVPPIAAADINVFTATVDVGAACTCSTTASVFFYFFSCLRKSKRLTFEKQTRVLDKPHFNAQPFRKPLAERAPSSLFHGENINTP